MNAAGKVRATGNCDGQVASTTFPGFTEKTQYEKINLRTPRTPLGTGKIKAQAKTKDITDESIDPNVRLH